MKEATFLSHHIFRCRYPVLKKHTNSQPFPLNGTFGNIPQIVRSIHRDYPKVKGKLKSAFTSYDCFARCALKNRMKKRWQPCFLLYTGFCARMNALTNFPSTSALSSS